MSRVKVRRPNWSSTTVTRSSPFSGVGHPVGEGPHRLYEVVAVADDPGAAHHVVPGAAGHGEVASGLGLAVDGEGAEGLPPSSWSSRVQSKT